MTLKIEDKKSDSWHLNVRYCFNILVCRHLIWI